MDSIRVLSTPTEEKSVRELLAALKSSPRLVAELAFFTSYYHCLLSLEAIRAQAERFSQIFPMVRAVGYRVGINHLATTGHRKEDFPSTLKQLKVCCVKLELAICYKITDNLTP